VLPMTFNSFVVRATLELQDDDFLAAALRCYFRLDPTPIYEGGSEFDVRTLTDEQYLIERDSRTLFRVEALHAQPIAFTRAILFAACSKHRIQRGVDSWSKSGRSEGPKGCVV